MMPRPMTPTLISDGIFLLVAGEPTPPNYLQLSRPVQIKPSYHFQGVPIPWRPTCS